MIGKASFITFTIIVLLTPLPCLSGGIKGDKELLMTVALRHKANLESILTWKGEAFEERRTTKKVDNYDYMLDSKLTFSYDQLQNSVRWNREPQEFRAESKGKSFSSTFSWYNSAIITEKASYTYRKSGTDENGNITFRVIIDEPYKGVRKIGNKGFDPRYFFSDGGDNTYKRLMFLYENADNPKLTERHIKREGDLVIMTLEKTVEGVIRTERQVFDLSAGGNLVEFYNSGSTYENHREYEYEEKSGVWILKSYKRLNITHREDGSHRSTRTIKWSNSVVNAPLDEDEFTIEKLGVKHGDYIQDNKIGKLYRYEGVLAEAPLRPKSLTGKPLPQFENFNIQISSQNTKDKMLLVCFWDMQQRPSRNCIMQLAKQANQLKQKSLTVVAVQASKVDKNALNKWIKRNNISFNVGMIEGNEEKIHFTWGLQSLPWLILTDKERIVRAEGFGINELNEKITMLTENQ